MTFTVESDTLLAGSRPHTDFHGFSTVRSVCRCFGFFCLFVCFTNKPCLIQRKRILCLLQSKSHEWFGSWIPSTLCLWFWSVSIKTTHPPQKIYPTSIFCLTCWNSDGSKYSFTCNRIIYLSYCVLAVVINAYLGTKTGGTSGCNVRSFFSIIGMARKPLIGLFFAFHKGTSKRWFIYLKIHAWNHWVGPWPLAIQQRSQHLFTTFFPSLFYSAIEMFALALYRVTMEFPKSWSWILLQEDRQTADKISPHFQKTTQLFISPLLQAATGKFLRFSGRAAVRPNEISQ